MANRFEKKTGRILVVDDEKDVCFVLSEILRHAGHEVQSAQTATEAMDLFEKSGVDVVLTDVNMPGRSGIDLLKDIKKLKPAIPVVIMTGYGSVDSYLEAMASGAFEYLYKPLEMHILQRVIEKALHAVQ